jgi:phosphohistidine phosphatase
MPSESPATLKRIFLLRHGHAERDAPRDELRNLTQRGRDEAAAVAGVIAAGGLRPSRVVSSPYVRARQTADIVSAALHCGPVVEVPGVTPDDPARRAAQVLDKLLAGQQDDVMLVTHMPLIGALVGLLCDGSADAGPAIETAAGVLMEGEFVAPGTMRVVREFHPSNH